MPPTESECHLLESLAFAVSLSPIPIYHAPTNEILQLRCDVVQDPFTICSRCRRLNLSCKVQENFKRVGKRSRNAEMEREIVELRKQIAEQTTPIKSNGLTTQNTAQSVSYASEDQYGSNEAVEGLMGLSGGLTTLKRIEDVLVTQDCIFELFNTQVARILVVSSRS